MRDANTTDNPIIKTTALAGTGKTMLVGVMLEAFLRHLPKNGAIFIFVPGRALRDEHVQSDEFAGALKRGTYGENAVVWLGRQAEGTDALAEWETALNKKVDEQMEASRSGLRAIEVDLSQRMRRLVEHGVNLHLHLLFNYGYMGFHGTALPDEFTNDLEDILAQRSAVTSVSTSTT